ncbi:Plant self-incompatibility s1 [Thalictrum thalictroides]|uniref:S-protein homolog n=1 Tax=Thalictrum thalictroides TaxID=46969 RepID=A0A7J6W7P0_THATH|nr:Plant self-incompatibility s1 [Thalictrum thalictroides]
MASAANNNNVLFVFLFTGVITLLWSYSSVSGNSSVSSFRIKSARVIVMNALGPNNTLTIHCKCKDDDLGEHNIAFNKSFEWSFTNHIFGKTLYWCRMWW